MNSTIRVIRRAPRQIHDCLCGQKFTDLDRFDAHLGECDYLDMLDEVTARPTTLHSQFVLDGLETDGERREQAIACYPYAVTAHNLARSPRQRRLDKIARDMKQRRLAQVS